MAKKNYKKMLEDIDKIVNNDWGFDMVDGKVKSAHIMELDKEAKKQLVNEECLMELFYAPKRERG